MARKQEASGVEGTPVPRGRIVEAKVPTIYQKMSFRRRLKLGILVISWDLRLKMHILKGTKVSMPTQSKLAEKGGGSEKYRKRRNGCYTQVD